MASPSICIWLGLLVLLVDTAVQASGCQIAYQCDTGTCFREVECQKVNCKEDGTDCNCKSCYSGISCNQYENQHVPVFKYPTDTAYVYKYSSTADPVYVAKASDSDANNCTIGDECPCGELEYFIIGETVDDLIDIDDSTGAVFASEKLLNDDDQDFFFDIGVKNPGESEHSLMRIHLILRSEIPIAVDKTQSEPQERDSSSVQTRYKRGTPTAIPTSEVEFHVDTIYANEDLQLGDTISFDVYIVLPATHQTGLTVEVFLPDDEEVFVGIGSATVALASDSSCLTLDDYTVDSINTDASTTTRDNVPYYDSYLFELGNMSTSSCSSSWNDNSLVLSYTLIAAVKSNFTNDANARVGCGAEYNDGGNIWVMSNSFTISQQNESSLMQSASRAPEFDLVGPETMEIGSTEAILLNMYIPYQYTTIVVTVFYSNDSIPDGLSFFHAELADKGENYQYHQVTSETTSLQAYPTSSGYSNSKMVLDLGGLSNTGNASERSSTTRVDEDLLSVQIIVNADNDEQLIDQELYYVVSVALGETAVWIADTPIQITAPDVNDTNTATADLPEVGNSLCTAEFSPGDTVECTVEMTTKHQTTYHYILEALSYYNDTSSLGLSACTMVPDLGSNLPTTRKIDDVTINSHGGIDNHVTLDLMGLYNIEVDTSNPETDLLRYKVYFKANNSEATDIGESKVIALGVNIGQAAIWVGLENSTLVENTTASTLASDELPVVYISDPSNTLLVPPGSQFQLDVDMYFYPGMKYKNVEMAFRTFIDSEFSICRLEPVSVGANMPCLSKSDLDAALVYQYEALNETIVGGSVSLSVIDTFNIVSNQNFSSDHSNRIAYRVYYRVADAWTNGSVTSRLPYVGVRPNSDYLWVGMPQLNVITNPTIPTKGDIQPEVTFGDNITTDIGSRVNVPILIKVPADVTVEYYTFMVDVGNTGGNLSVCDLSLTGVGESFLCGVPVISTTINEFKTIASITVGPLHYFATAEKYTDNALEVNALELSLNLLVSTSLQNSTFDAEFEVVYPDGISPDYYSIPIHTSADPPDNLVGMNVNFSWVENDNMTDSFVTIPTGSQFHVGESIRFIASLAFDVDYNPPKDLSVHIVSLDNDNSIWDVTQLKVLNLKQEDFDCCAFINKTGFTDETITSLSNRVEERFISLGVIYPCPDRRPVTIDLEGYVRMRFDGTDPTSSTALVVKAGESDIFVNLINGSLNEYPPSDTVQIMPLPAIELSIPTIVATEVWATEEVEFSVTIPPFSIVYIEFYVEQHQAIFQFGNLSLRSAGRNVDDILMEPTLSWVYTEYENFKQTQIPKTAVYSLGTVTNKGNSYKAGDNSNLDADNLVLVLSVEVLDSVAVIGTHNFSLGVKYNNNTQYEVVPVFDVSDQDKLQADMVTTANMDCSNLDSSEVLVIRYNLEHGQASTAVPVMVQLKTFIPPFLKLSSHTINSYGFPYDEAVAINTTAGRHFTVQLPSLKWTGSVDIELIFNMVPATKNNVKLNGVSIPWKVSYLSNRTAVDRTHESLTALNCSVPITIRSKHGCPIENQINVTAAQIRAAPLVDGTVFGDLLSSSTIMNFGSRHPAHLYSARRYALIDLLDVYNIQSLSLNCTDSTFGYSLLASKDGIAWSPYASNPITANSGQRFYINIVARFLRINLLSSSPDVIGFYDFAAYGCLWQRKDGQAKALPPEYNLAPRQFLITNSHLMICDSKPLDMLPSHCHSFNLDTSAWHAMDNRIRNLVGLEFASGNDIVLAVDERGNYVRSKDGGHIWYSINSADRPKMAIDKTPMEVPWKTNLTEVYDTHPTSGIQYFANDAGIHRAEGSGGIKIYDWYTCCS